jgi:hypothetical protein
MHHKKQYRGIPLNPKAIASVRAEFLPLLHNVDDQRQPYESYTVWHADTESTFDTVDDLLRHLVVGGSCERICFRIGAPSLVPPNLTVWAFFDFSQTSIEITGLAEPEAYRFVDRTAELLDVQQQEQAEVSDVPDRSAFIAHSFDELGNALATKVERLLKILGFGVVTGKRYSSTTVSGKVKQRIREQGIVVSIVTKQDAASSEGQSLSMWVAQESAFAEGAHKPLFLLVQRDADFNPGLHGDLERIPFDVASLDEAFLKLLEGLNDLGFTFSDE